MEDRQQEIIIKLEKLKDQVLHLESVVDSERGTIAREHKRIHDEIKASSVEMKSMINEIKSEIKEVITNPDDGLMIKVDRLMQDKARRDSERKQIIAIWIMLGSIVIKYLFEIFSPKH